MASEIAGCSGSVGGIYNASHQKSLCYNSVYSPTAGRRLDSWQQIDSRKDALAGGVFWSECSKATASRSTLPLWYMYTPSYAQSALHEGRCRFGAASSLLEWRGRAVGAAGPYLGGAGGTVCPFDRA